MNLKSIAIGLTVAVGMAFSYGCSARITEFTIISTKNVDIKGKRGVRTKGDDCIHIILGFPVGVPNLKNAIDRTIEGAGPGFDSLEDGVIGSSNWSAILYGQMCYWVEGTPVATKMGADKASLENRNLMMHSGGELSN